LTPPEGAELAGRHAVVVGRGPILGKPAGVLLLDAGYNPGDVGDVDFESAGSRAGLITPVPGGGGR
jgi:5,10-methylene-tetrahydrofolate dehydrogenase/methenyl tetrahydrofolate cyclohydrolase